MAYDHARRSSDNCPVRRTVELLSGRWRLLVLFHLEADDMRWGALRRALDPITPRVLTATLRALEEDGLVWRHEDDSALPMIVTYGLTERGRSLRPVFAAMLEWGTTEG